MEELTEKAATETPGENSDQANYGGEAPTVENGGLGSGVREQKAFPLEAHETIEYKSRRWVELQAIADAYNLDLVLPTENQLFVDIDSDADLDRFHAIMPTFEEKFPVTNVKITASKSGHPERKHITVTLAGRVSDLKRVAMQAILGSDATRELLSLSDIDADVDAPTVFFEKKEGAGQGDQHA